VGKLTLRGVTRELRVPLTIRKVGAGLEISGEVTVRRLDYGVGQGEWKSTEWVGNDVKLQYKVPLVPADP
jgi:polyisoprenoid-binding protein YceI